MNATRSKILVSEPLSQAGLDALRGEFDVDVRTELASEGLVEAIGPYAALIVRSQTKVTAAVVEAAPVLRVVGRAGVGLDNVDVAAATRRGVIVVNAPRANILSAAEHTMALMLALMRNVPQAHASLLAGRWERGTFKGRELSGKTLGVIGLGGVGALVAERARAFGMRVVAFDPYISPERAVELSAEAVPDLPGLLARADVVTIHLPRTPETEGLIGGEELALMKEGARLVDAARGGIVDEPALYDALRSGHLAGAALDVFSREPPGANPLFELPNVVVTPHLGASTLEAQDRVSEEIADGVGRALRGEPVPAAVNAPPAPSPFA